MHLIKLYEQLNKGIIERELKKVIKDVEATGLKVKSNTGSSIIIKDFWEGDSAPFSRDNNYWASINPFNGAITINSVVLDAPVYILRWLLLHEVLHNIKWIPISVINGGHSFIFYNRLKRVIEQYRGIVDNEGYPLYKLGKDGDVDIQEILNNLIEKDLCYCKCTKCGEIVQAPMGNGLNIMKFIQKGKCSKGHKNLVIDDTYTSYQTLEKIDNFLKNKVYYFKCPVCNKKLGYEFCCDNAEEALFKVSFEESPCHDKRILLDNERTNRTLIAKFNDYCERKNKKSYMVDL